MKKIMFALVFLSFYKSYSQSDTLVVVQADTTGLNYKIGLMFDYTNLTNINKIEFYKTIVGVAEPTKIKEVTISPFSTYFLFNDVGDIKLIQTMLQTQFSIAKDEYTQVLNFSYKKYNTSGTVQSVTINKPF